MTLMEVTDESRCCCSCKHNIRTHDKVWGCVCFNAHVRGEIRVPDALLEETGIDIMSATTARECGAKGDAII